MTTRPAAFDKALMAYMPHIRSLARRYIPSGKRTDVIQDVLTYCLEHWENYRGESYETGSGFANWVTWQFRGVVSNYNYRQRREIPTTYGNGADKAFRAAAANDNQERALMARDILGRAEGRAGAVILRRGMGCGLAEIGQDIGISRERVRQIEIQGMRMLASIAGVDSKKTKMAA